MTGSLNIEYGGSALQPRTCYRWDFDAWTNEGTKLSATSRFETGLMVRNDADKAWNGAKWIGGGSGDMVLYSHYLPVFRLDYVFRLDSATQTVKTAFTYGANDERLMNAGKNIFGLASKPGETYIKVELDADSTRHGQAAKVRIYRAGYCPDDNPDRPLAEFDVPTGLFNKDNMYGEHTLRLTNNLGHTCLYLDNEEEEIGYAGLNPIGQGGDFIAFPVVGDVGFCRRGDAETAIKVGNTQLPQPWKHPGNGSPTRDTSRRQQRHAAYQPEQKRLADGAHGLFNQRQADSQGASVCHCARNIRLLHKRPTRE